MKNSIRKISSTKAGRQVSKGAGAQLNGDDLSNILSGISPDALIATSPEGKVLFWNAGAEALFGYSRGEAEGCHLSQLTAPANLADDASNVTSEASESGVTVYETVRRRKDGSSIYVDITSKEIRDEQGKATFIALYEKDITHLKVGRDAKALAARFHGLLESVPDAIVMVNAIGLILLVNSHTELLFSYKREELLGKSVEILLPERYRSVHVGHRNNFFLEPRPRSMGVGIDLYGRRKDGTEFPVEISLSPLDTEEGMLVAAAIRDVSERKLQEELRRRTLEEASRLKSEFLANMSHELRTPLNGIIGFSQMMYDERLGPVSKQHREYLGDILTSSQHLLRLINDVLDLAKVEAGKMEFQPEPIELDLIVRETCDVLRGMAAEKRLRIEISMDPAVNSLVLDSSKLKQVLYNYLSNAIKFSGDEGEIKVSTAPEGPKGFRIEVEDTGIGITPEDIEKLFVEFQQLNGTATKQYPGTGLGLALTKKIVEAQGGRVGVTSIWGKGSTFFVILPRDSNAPSSSFEVSNPVRPGPSLLIIEDDAKERTWLAQTLAGAGYNVNTASNGSRALALCRARRYDGITLDLVLPDISGQDLLSQIRRDSLNRETPVMVVSLVAGNPAAMGYRVSEFLVKPVSEGNLIAAIKRSGIIPDDAPKILCVDDDPKSLKLAEVVLRSSGYIPLCESNCRAALKVLEVTRPAAIILDLMMPGMDGFEFLEQLRRRPESRETPVIVWTVKDITAGDRDRLQASAQGIVIKGHSGITQLFAELEKYVARPTSP